MPCFRVRSTNRGVAADLVERASKSVKEGRSIRIAAQELNIPVASLARYVKKRRDLIEQGSSLMPSVGFKGCNAVFTAEKEIKLVSYVSKAAALYFGLPPKEVGIH